MSEDAGLSRAVVVVEAAARSGSLITAKSALDQGREVFAVPGHPFDARASGCNMLIRDGATLVRGAGDVIEALEAQPVTAAELAPQKAAAAPGKATMRVPSRPEYRKPAETAVLHDMILNRLGPSPLAEDQLIRDLARPAAEITPELVSLELEGRIQRQPGGLVNRVG